jgi:hypothetical protein
MPVFEKEERKIIAKEKPIAAVDKNSGQRLITEPCTLAHSPGTP